MPGEEMMTTQEVANELRVTGQTVRMLVRNGRLPAIRIGVGDERVLLRFRRADVDAWLAERLVGRR